MERFKGTSKDCLKEANMIWLLIGVVAGAVGMLIIVHNNPALIHPWLYMRGKRDEVADRLQQSIKKRLG